MENHTLADKNIGKLLLKLSLPATFGMLVMAMYNVVDTIFVGRGVGANAIAGVSILFPFSLIVMSMAMLFGIGGSSLFSRSLGEGKLEKARLVLSTSFISVIISSILIIIVSYILGDKLLYLFGATENILPYSKEYFSIIMPGCILFSLAITGNNFARADGQAKIAMISMTASAIINIILDAIFIFVFKWGVLGAAIATAIAQLFSVIYLIRFFISKKFNVQLKAHDVKFIPSLIKPISAIGVSSFSRQLAGSVIFIVINNLLKFHGGDLALSAFGIINRVLSLVMMPIFGIAQGLQPIAGYNYGAKRYHFTKLATKYALIAATCVSVFGFAVSLVFPETIINVFTDDAKLIEMGSTALVYVMLAFPVVGFQVISASMFQAIGKAIPSLVLTLSRQVFLLLPLLVILSRFWQLKGVLMAFPFSDALSFAITGIYMYFQFKNFNKAKVLS